MSRFVDNRPCSIYKYSNMAPRLSGQISIFGVVFFVSKSLLGIEGQRKLEKFAILTRKPRSHVRLLIYGTRPIENTDSDLNMLKVHSLHYANELLVLAFQKLLQTRQTSRNNRKLCKKKVLLMIEHCLANSEINSIPEWRVFLLKSLRVQQARADIIHSNREIKEIFHPEKLTFFFNPEHKSA